MRTSRPRNKRGQYRKSHLGRLLPLFILMATVFACYYFQASDGETFNPRADLVSPLPETRLVELAQAQVIEITPTPTQVPTSEKQEIMHYIVNKFGDDANLAITMLTKCENSKLNPEATNHNRNGTIDRGIFQINSIHGGDEMFNWKTNVDKAYELYTKRGNKFTDWTCAHVINQKNYLGQ